MNLRDLQQQYAGLCDRQQALVSGAVQAGRPLTGEEQADFNNLQQQIDALAVTIAAAKAVESRAKGLEQPEGKLYRPGLDDGSAGSDRQGEILDDGGFQNVGEFLFCVKNGDQKGRLNRFRSDLGTSDVGVLIPPAFSQQVLQLQPEAEIVMPRAMVIPAGEPPDAPFAIPYFRQGDAGALGGIKLTWTAEGKTVADAGDPDFPDLVLQPQEVSGMATINNKTLQNWAAAGDFITQLLRQAWVTGRDYKFLRGSGAGCPLGVLNATGAIKVKRKDANKIQFIDIVNMLGRLYPESLSNAVWITNITSLPQIATIKDEAGEYIFVRSDATKGLASTLMGLPLKFTGKTPALGSAGDLALLDLSKYLIKNGSGPYVAISEHVKFASNKVVFKIVANIDGQPWVKEPLKLEDGSTTVSPFIILQ